MKSSKPPVFLVDENLPFNIARMLCRKGYPAFHVRELFGKRGVRDRIIMRYAEMHNMVILTRDRRFPEPAVQGDRLLVIDLPKLSSEKEVLRRIRQLWR